MRNERERVREEDGKIRLEDSPLSAGGRVSPRDVFPKILKTNLRLLPTSGGCRVCVCLCVCTSFKRGLHNHGDRKVFSCLFQYFRNYKNSACLV